MPTWSDGLNPAQIRAATHDSGPLIVLAGPGTGKTKVIVARIARLIESGAAPESILALAFNIRAAAELRERLAAAINPRDAQRVQAMTFHAFGFSIIRRFGDWIGARPEARIIDSAEQKRLLRRLILEHDIYPQHAARGRLTLLSRAAKFIEACRNAARTPSDAERFARRWNERLNSDASDAAQSQREQQAEFAQSARLFALFEAECLQQGLMTYEDCLTLPLRIFAERSAVAAILRDELRHIVVDEFQDQNAAQIEILRRLAPPANSPDLCIVGDDDQAIYGFRGGNALAFSRFAEIWPQHTRLALTINYRSAPPVIAASNAIISECGSRFAPDKSIVPGPAAATGSVEGVILPKDSHSGVVIASIIALARRQAPETPFSSFGVIARGNRELVEAAAELERLGIPANLRRAVTPADNEGVKDLLAWIDLLTQAVSPLGTAAVRRLLSRTPFSIDAGELAAWIAEFSRERVISRDTVSLVDWLQRRVRSAPAIQRFFAMHADLKRIAATQRADRVIMEIIRAADLGRSEDLSPADQAHRISDLVAVLRFARERQARLEPPGDLEAFARYRADLEEFERNFQQAPDDRLDSDETTESTFDAVQLITAHKAKGLEFDTVILLKCRPTGFPGRDRSATKTVEQVLPEEFEGGGRVNETDEERRVFYVACTRARRRLLLFAERRAGKSKTVDYFSELLGPPPLMSPVVEAVTLIEQAGLAGDDAAPGDQGMVEHRIERAVRDEMAAVRRHAYAALHDAAVADLSADGLRAVRERLAESADALHALERMRCGCPPTIELPESYRARLTALSERLAREPEPPPSPFTRVMPAPFRLSYTFISDYERCPACFYFKHIEHVPEEETEALSLGNMVHKALERFYGEWRESEAQGTPPPDSARLRSVAEHTIREMWRPSVPFDAAILDRALAMLLGAHERLFDRGTNILELERSVTFDYPDPDTPTIMHKLTCKIDRIDQLPDGRFVLIDYKTGKAKGLLEPAADDLQLAMYALALPAVLDADDGLLFRPPPAGFAEYWVLSEHARGRIAFADLDVAGARQRIDNAIRGIRAGKFDPLNKCKGLCAALLSTPRLESEAS